MAAWSLTDLFSSVALARRTKQPYRRGCWRSWPPPRRTAIDIGPNDPSKWLCRKRNGSWWIWKPHDYLPLIELKSFDEVRVWKP
jgi:hypothetical protein